VTSVPGFEGVKIWNVEHTNNFKDFRKKNLCTRELKV
jgi:hypothetical protein